MPLTIPMVALGRRYDMLPSWVRPVEFKVVQSTAELKAAAGLVYREYLGRHYLKPASPQMKLTIYHALPQTTTFIARHRRHGIIGTITLIEDSPLGLPIDDGYKAELDLLRRQGLRLAEAAFLALDSQCFGPGVFTMFHSTKLLLTLRLLKTMFDYLKVATSADELVACFNPKHHVLFEFLQMQHLGGLKTYAGANGTPTVARRLPLAETAQIAQSHPAHRLFYDGVPSTKPFAKKLVLSPEELRLLFVLDSSIFASASPTELAHIASCYPQYAFGRILEGALPPSGTTLAPPLNRPTS